MKTRIILLSAAFLLCTIPALFIRVPTASAQDCLDYSNYLHWTAEVYHGVTDGQGVAVSGHYAFFADGGSGLEVIDISDPESPRLSGWVNTPDRALNVTVTDDYAYVADRHSGLQVIDISPF